MIRRTITLVLSFFSEAARLFLARGRLGFCVVTRRQDSVIEQWLPEVCERLGGAFPKVGQILSTRTDLLPGHICRGLSRLQNQVIPIELEIVRRTIQQEYPSQPFRLFVSEPEASATIAQVHRAIRGDDGREVALKIMRPGVRKTLVTDCSVAKVAGKILACLPAMRSIPVREAIFESSEILVGQTDFERESSNLDRLGLIFAESQSVLVPGLHRDLCTPNILCMDYIAGMRKISDPELEECLAKEALLIGVRALYRMIFSAGFIHCDMHPGNILIAPRGRLVILDAGFMVEIDDATRRSFAEFFLAIAFSDGKRAAQIVRETAMHLPSDLNIRNFDEDISNLIERIGGLKAGDFQVVSFVSKLFEIQRKHGIYGTSKFTLIILSLLVYEGVAKQRFPDLDFQQEAVPFVLEALAR